MQRLARLNFMFYLVGVLVSLILVDFTVGGLLIHLYLDRFITKDNASFHALLLNTQTHPDMVIFGSSRALHSYIDEQLSSMLNKRVLNAGGDGRGILMATALLAAIPKANLPTYVLLDVHCFGSLEKKRLNLLYPYYGILSPKLDHILEANIKTTVLLHSRMYRMNGLTSSLLLRIIGIKKPHNSSYFFDPLKGCHLTKARLKAAIERPVPLERKCPGRLLVHLLDGFIHIAQERQVHIILGIAPYPREFLHAHGPIPSSIRTQIATIRHYASEHNIPLLDHSEMQQLTLDDFCDTSHLNSRGAEKFTHVVGEELKRLLGQPPQTMSSTVP